MSAVRQEDVQDDAEKHLPTGRRHPRAGGVPLRGMLELTHGIGLDASDEPLDAVLSTGECHALAEVAVESHLAAPRVSVVVPTCRRPLLLDRCLAGLAAQELPADEYEIVVADDARSDETRRQVAGWAERLGEQGPRIRYVHPESGRGPAAARNAGWRAARGAVIAFTDDDCVPEPGWLRAGLGALAEEVAGVSGQIVLPLRSRPTDYELNAAHLACAEFVTANCFYRREAIARAGGFDERFTAAWREDSDLHFALRRSGERLAHAPEAVVVHPIREAAWGVSLRQQRKSQFNALLYKKHPELYRQRVQASPPWRYYATVAALVGALLGFVTGHLWLVVVFAGIWALLTARFCVQRLARTSHAPRHVAEMVVTSALIPPLAIFWRLYGAIKFRVWFL